MLASDSLLSDTNTDIDSDPLFIVDALTLLHAPVRLSLVMHEKISDMQGAFFEGSAKYKGQKLILFGRCESEPITRENSKDNDNSLITIDMHIV